jgi:hypothetical protein
MSVTVCGGVQIFTLLYVNTPFSSYFTKLDSQSIENTSITECNSLLLATVIVCNVFMVTSVTICGGSLFLFYILQHYYQFVFYNIAIDSMSITLYDDKGLWRFHGDVANDLWGRRSKFLLLYTSRLLLVPVSQKIVQIFLLIKKIFLSECNCEDI